MEGIYFAFRKVWKIPVIALTNKQPGKTQIVKAWCLKSFKYRRHQCAEECRVSLRNTALLRGPSARQGIPTSTVNEQQPATKHAPALMRSLIRVQLALWDEHTTWEPPKGLKVPSDTSSPAFQHDSLHCSVQITSYKIALSVQLFLINSRYWCLNISCTEKQLLFKPNFFKRNHYNILIIAYLSEEDNTDTAAISKAILYT